MRAFAVAAAFAVFLIPSCKEDDDHTHGGGAPSCDAIVEACHPLDTGSGPIHECHEAAEDEAATEEKCAGQKAACLALCKAPDGGGDAARD